MKNIPLVTITFLSLVVGTLFGHFVWVDYPPHGSIMTTERYNSHTMKDGSSMMMNEQDMVGMENMMLTMTANMKGKTGTELEKSFITEMIPHHQGAVDMAKLLLEDKTITSKELVGFAKNVITAQESEIIKMKIWLKNY
jgi:uncharacterized protein (DUF305 family)